VIKNGGYCLDFVLGEFRFGKLLAERGLGDQQFGTFSGVHLGVFSSLALREAQESASENSPTLIKQLHVVHGNFRGPYEVACQ